MLEGLVLWFLRRGGFGGSFIQNFGCLLVFRARVFRVLGDFNFLPIVSIVVPFWGYLLGSLI